jgi:C_GCAxxG_C_C family probable redox protein
VLLAVCQELRIESGLIPRIATAFGGGIGRTGTVCGAVVGATMAIGLKHGREEASQPHDRAYALAQEFRHCFEEEMGTISCRELTGMDLSTPEGLDAFHSSDVAERVCQRARGVAFRAVMKLLDGQRG